MSIYTARQLYPWLWQIGDCLNVNFYLFLGAERALLFDTCHGLPGLREVVDSITPLPLTVVLGHGHYDHAGGSYLFDQAFLDPSDFELCRRHTSRPLRETALGNAAGASLSDGRRETFLNAGTGKLLPLLTGNEFDLGGLRLQVMAMPGHTHGSVGLLDLDHRVLFDSDSANGNTWMFLEESMPLYIYAAMLRRVAALGFDTLYTAHDRDPLPASVFEKYIAAAVSASLEFSRPYENFLRAGARIYECGGVSVAFSVNTLNG